MTKSTQHLGDRASIDTAAPLDLAHGQIERFDLFARPYSKFVTRIFVARSAASQLKAPPLELILTLYSDSYSQWVAKFGEIAIPGFPSRTIEVDGGCSVSLLRLFELGGQKIEKGLVNAMPIVDAPTTNERSTAQPDPLPQPESARRSGRRETLEERLKLRQAQIAARLHAIATQKKAETREREARLDGIIGAACRADKTTHDSVKRALKGVKLPADREFLKIEGWL